MYYLFETLRLLVKDTYALQRRRTYLTNSWEHNINLKNLMKKINMDTLKSPLEKGLRSNQIMSKDRQQSFNDRTISFAYKSII